MTTPGQSLFVIWDQGTGDTHTALETLAGRSPAGISISFADKERLGGDLLTEILVPGIRAADRVLVAFPPDDALAAVAFETGIAIGLGKPIAVLELRASSYLLSYACDLLFGSEILENGITFDLTELHERLHDPLLWHVIQMDAEPPVNSDPLIICPQAGIGMELRKLLKKLRPDWNSPILEDPGSNVIQLAQKAIRLLWVVVPDESRRPWASVLSALISGFFYGASLARGAERPLLEVLWHKEAPKIGAAEQRSRPFETLEGFKELLTKESKAPFIVQKLMIRNYKNIDRLDVDFTPPSSLPGNWTCIAGVNGAGKSSILEALSMVLLGDPLVADLGSVQLTRSLRRQGEQRFDAEITAILSDGQEEVTLYLPVSEQQVDSVRLKEHPEYLRMQSFWRGLKERVLVAYGASRNLSETREDQNRKIDPLVLRLKTLFDPHAQIASVEALLEGGASFDPVLRTLRKILEVILPKDLPSRRERDDQRPLFGQERADVEAIELPDGFRSTVAWLADLCAAWHETAPWEETWNSEPAQIRAIVLLDEIDLHLHPSLQRQLVPRLREALPNVQFIVTTHSPLVLSSFDRNELVVLDRNEESRVRELDRQILAFSADQVYQWLMETSPQSVVIEEKLRSEDDPNLALYEYQSENRNEEEARAALEERRLRVERLRRSVPR